MIGISCDLLRVVSVLIELLMTVRIGLSLLLTRVRLVMTVVLSRGPGCLCVSSTFVSV